MIIKVDVEAEQLLSGIIDVYVKTVGLKGIQVVNKISTHIERIEEEKVVKKEEEKNK